MVAVCVSLHAISLHRMYIRSMQQDTYVVTGADPEGGLWGLETPLQLVSYS